MESQPNSQLVERIGPKIAALAATGLCRWEPVKIDIDLLTDVPLVQTRLDGLDAGDRANPDAKLKAISDALETAIQTLSKPYRQAALHHFGFTEKDCGKPSSQGDREHRAAKAWGYGGGWYRRPREEYFGMKTGEYVIALATCAFCGIADPIAYIAKREGANAEAAPNGPQEGQATSDDIDISDATDASSGN